MFVLALLVLCGCGALVASLPQKQYYHPILAEKHFEQFMRTYDRHYATEQEKQMRFEIFKENLVKINKLNEEDGLAVFGVTLFSDHKSEEIFMNYDEDSRSGLDMGSCTKLTDEDVPFKGAPEVFDWRQHNAVTGVKNQNTCGSCWAFSAIGTVEGQYAIKYGQIAVLSEQQLVDCDDSSNGCKNGYTFNALSKLVELGGSESGADYPYVNSQQTCNFDPAKVRVKVTGCKMYEITNQDVLKELLYQTGPLSIILDGNAVSEYIGGIVETNKCAVPDGAHAVLLVGYGTENGVPYWTIKNSWGENFGENGYFRMHRGQGYNVCRMMDRPISTAIVA